MNFRSITLGVIAALISSAGSLASCSPSTPAPEDSVAQQQPSPSSPQPCLHLHLAAANEISSGQSLDLRLSLENTCQDSVEAYLGGRPAYDFLVTGTEGEEVWRWSHGEAIQAILEVKVLGPGEALVFEAAWDLRSNEGGAVPPGRYQVRGILRGDPPQVFETDPAPLVITS